MISIKEFFNSTERLAIHCVNNEQVKKLCCRFIRLGYRQKNKQTYFINFKTISDAIFVNDGTIEYPLYESAWVDSLDKIYMFDIIDDFNFKVGEKVRVREINDLINEYESATEEQRLVGGKEFVIKSIIKYGINSESYAICTGDDRVDFYRIPINMLEKVYEETKILMPTSESIYAFNNPVWPICTGRMNDEKIIISSRWKKNIPIEFNPNYSFRFNEQRRNVSLYKNGKRVQLIKPLPGDPYDWLIGLGVAIYREIFKGFPEVEYLKGTNWEKDFYKYCVVKFFDFELKKVDILKERVKTCEREHCEFQLTKLRHQEVPSDDK